MYVCTYGARHRTSPCRARKILLVREPTAGSASAGDGDGDSLSPEALPACPLSLAVALNGRARMAPAPAAPSSRASDTSFRLEVFFEGGDRGGAGGADRSSPAAGPLMLPSRWREYSLVRAGRYARAGHEERACVSGICMCV